ncbi:MAG: hypothetical protein U9Q77_00380 [Candidatus Marinimicrobia bacterium]|nr:hypothetical protein [Candidatus Neomarinimicrobiota bacterium]
MKNIKWLLINLVVLLFIMSCASKVVQYDLPSVEATATPEWVKTQASIRDTIFIVIHLPKAGHVDLNQSIQSAQSELHTVLANEIEVILRDYWDQKEVDHNEDVAFKLISELPLTLEHIMQYVTIRDGWEQSGNISILCALDYEQATEVLMTDMEIKDRAFRSYFKRRMDHLAQDHR